MSTAVASHSDGGVVPWQPYAGSWRLGDIPSHIVYRLVRWAQTMQAIPFPYLQYYSDAKLCGLVANTKGVNAVIMVPMASGTRNLPTTTLPQMRRQQQKGIKAVNEIELDF